VGIDQAPDLQKHEGPTTHDLARRSLMVGIPAHDEETTIAQAVHAARAGLDELGVRGRVVVAASGCTDRTAARARRAGASVVETPRGKGSAVRALARTLDEEAMALVDADVAYYGARPLAALVAEPVVRGIADASVADLYWRPIYPRMWELGFYGPLVGRLLPEVLGAFGGSAWTGQRAAAAPLWRGAYPRGFAVETALNLRWGLSGARCVAVASEDWIQPVRPKRPFFASELRLVLDAAEARGRLAAPRATYTAWLDVVVAFMGTYVHDETDVRAFELALAGVAHTHLP
jgi:hypothetical protein